MSDELAQDENDAADYDLETMHPNEEEEGSRNASGRASPQLPVEHVVFDITHDDPSDSEEHPILPK